MSFFEILISNLGIFWIKTGILTEQCFKHMAYTCWLRIVTNESSMCSEVSSKYQACLMSSCFDVFILYMNSDWPKSGDCLGLSASSPPEWKSGQKSCPPKCFFSRLAYCFQWERSVSFRTPGVWRGAKHLFNLFWTLHTCHFFCSALGNTQRSSQLPNHSGRGAGQIPHRPITKSCLYNCNWLQQEAW